jgi:hypothetical protein
MARLYADENLPLPVVEDLRRRGHDVLTALEAGLAGQATPDNVILAASSDQRVLLTLNRRHFVRLHRVTPQHSGIVVCSAEPDCGALAQRIHTALAGQPSLQGQLVRVDRPNTGA